MNPTTPVEQNEYVADYLIEALERLERLNHALISLEDGDSKSLELIQRELHTLKGLSSSVGFQEVSSLCHEMEDLLSQSAADEKIPLLLKGCDYLEQHSRAVQSGQSPPPTPDLKSPAGSSQKTPSATAKGSSTSQTRPQVVEQDGAVKRRNLRFMSDVEKVSLVLKFPAKVLNESMGGIGIEMDSAIPLTPGQVVEIEYLQVNMPAVVRWSKEVNGKFRVGFEWV